MICLYSDISIVMSYIQSIVSVFSLTNLQSNKHVNDTLFMMCKT